jgi:hypothetical protein
MRVSQYFLSKAWLVATTGGMKFALWLFMVVLLAGCDTFKSPYTPEEQKARAAQRRLEDQQRHEADLQRQDDDQRHHAQEDLRRKYSRYTTAELKMMHAHYYELTGHSGTRDLTLNPAATKLWGTSDQANTEKLIDVERELLRRYQAGDQEAKL